MTNLLNLKPGEKGFVLRVEAEMGLKRRLRDIGFINGAEVMLLHSSPSGDPRAYKIKGAVIALRNIDAKNIIIRKKSDDYG